MNGWVSPRLKIRFELGEGDLRIYGPDGQPFATYVELVRQREDLARKAEEQERKAEQDHQRAERLAAQLRAMGVDPEN